MKKDITKLTDQKSKITIRVQFALIFAAFMIATVVVLLLINSLFLERFYIRNKESAIMRAYESIAQAADDSALQSEEFDIELEMAALKYSIDVMVIDVDSKTVSAKCKDFEAMRIAIWDRVFATDIINNDDVIVEQTGDYQLLITQDSRSGIEYIEMWGFLKNGNVFLMRSALQSIEESARITNIFLILAGTIVLMLGSFVVFKVSKRVAKPILELAEISEKMGELDFDAKYTGNSQNEIGLLGSNINKMSETLENTISELKTANVELRKDIEKKEQLEEMRSEFISNVSHELKTPIALIQGYAEGLSEGISDDKESRDYYCSVICDEAGKMNNMVKKLLTLNELEFGSDTVKIVRVDISTLIKNRIQASEIITKNADIEVELKCDDNIYVWGDEYRLEEVFTNLFSNAINHCDYDKKIIVTVESEENEVKVRVRNTGNQIPEESLEHLFEKFYKVDKARTRAYGGSGIGLSIVKAVQESLNHEYGVLNHEDGVEFWVTWEKA